MHPVVTEIFRNEDTGSRILNVWTKGDDLTSALRAESVVLVKETAPQNDGYHALLNGNSDIVTVHAADLVNIPLEVLVPLMAKTRRLYFYCRSGVYLGRAVDFMRENGYRVDVKSGIVAVASTLSDKEKLFHIQSLLNRATDEETEVGQDVLYDLEVLKEAKHVSVYIGGGIGDVIHHGTMDDHMRALPQFRKLFPDVTIRLYAYGVGTGINLLAPYFDEVIPLSAPMGNLSSTVDAIDGNYPYMDTFLKAHGYDIKDLVGGFFVIDKLRKYITEGPVPYAWLTNAITVHPFVSYEEKTAFTPESWIAIIEYLLEQGHHVLVVGDMIIDKVKHWNTPIVEYVEKNGVALSSLVGMEEGTVVPEPCIVYSDDNFHEYHEDSFPILCGMMYNTRMLLAGDSSFRHAARHLEFNHTLIMNIPFYNASLSHMIESEYDYTWHPESLYQRMRKYDDVDDYTMPYANVVWVTPNHDIEKEYPANMLYNRYMKPLFTVSGLCMIPIQSHLKPISQELIRLDGNGFTLDESKKWEIPFCLYHIITPLRSGAVALDAGCGTSVLPRYLAERGVSVIGVDSMEYVETNPSWTLPIDAAKELGLAIDYVEGDITDHIPAADKSIDYVFCISVLEHIRTKAKKLSAIKELARVAKIGGYVALSWDLSWRDLDPDNVSKHDGLLTADELMSLIPNELVPVRNFEYTLEAAPTEYAIFDFKDLAKMTKPWCKEHGFAAAVFRKVR